jgi:lipopolysaccharide/colanic/teichoic acid biosynthesis glycosyltransferase
MTAIPLLPAGFATPTYLAPLPDAALPAPVPGWKRLLDLALTLPGLLALVPLFLAIALAVRLTSPGPVFFVQIRIGRGGRSFGMIKFRSMYRDAEARRTALLVQSDRPGLCFKARNDPRITPVGRLLRRLSLDELPQLLNVLAGQMSLVGPRPALPEEVAVYPARALGRLAVLPGITGPWQVSGRAEIGFDEMVEMDLAYARRPSLMADLSFLARTVSAVVSGRGAY